MLARFGELPADLREGSNDLSIYREAGEAILRGELPYRDFFIEYPPGSLPAFLPPALLAGEKATFIQLFAVEMALALVATLVLTALSARRMWGTRDALVAAVTFAAGAIMLYPVAVTRYDAVVALALSVATLCATLGGRYLYVAHASLGFGAAAKLVPALATVPLAFVGRREAARGYRGYRGYAVFFMVLALFFVPALLFGGQRFLESFAYHADRGLQVESLAASILMQLGWVSGITFEYGAFEVQGRGVELAGSLGLLLSLALLLLTALVMYREHRTERPDARRFARYAAALILAFMIGSKVLSPQYMVWLLPLVPLSMGGFAGIGASVVFLAACWTTTQVFPIHYADLLSLRFPGPELLLGRNLLLVLLWALLLFAPEESSAKEAA